MFHDSKIGKSFQCARSKGTAIAKEMSALLLSMSALFLLENPLQINLWFVPEILVFVCETSLKFDFWGRHAWKVKLSPFEKFEVGLKTAFNNFGER